MPGKSTLIRLFATFFFIAFLAQVSLASDTGGWKMPEPDQDLLVRIRQDEDQLNLFCLKSAYPQVRSLERDPQGDIWLVLDGGKRVLYQKKSTGPGRGAEGDNVTVAQSMALPYLLEPQRPDLPAAHSPGRERSLDLLAALYGGTQAEVRKGLVATPFRHRKISLSHAPAMAFRAAQPELERLAAGSPALAPFLAPDGGFNWRRIAGETRPSPHSYGIALDLGSKVAPYWRWAKTSSHPMQKTYSSEIVRVMENKGFIWGGKWREYDLMHFEYRPELICKARIRAIH